MDIRSATMDMNGEHLLKFGSWKERKGWAFFSFCSILTTSGAASILEIWRSGAYKCTNKGRVIKYAKTAQSH
eukprot:scaffold1307_cov166-Ochromonas_danica.AAC.36